MDDLHDAFDQEIREEVWAAGVWITKELKILHVSEMTSHHLLSVLRHMIAAAKSEDRQIDFNYYQSDWRDLFFDHPFYEPLLVELLSRDLGDVYEMLVWGSEHPTNAGGPLFDDTDGLIDNFLKGKI